MWLVVGLVTAGLVALVPAATAAPRPGDAARSGPYAMDRPFRVTTNPYPDGIRVSEPVNPLVQAQALAGSLRHPPALPGSHAFDSGRPSFLLVARTRVGTFG